MCSPSPKGRRPRSEELCKVHLISSDVSIPPALNLLPRGGGGENAGLLGSLPKGRKISPRGKAEAAAAGEASRLDQAVARASPRRPAGSRRRAQLRRSTLDGRPEGQSRLQYLSPGAAAAQSVRERNFLLRRPLSGPGVCGGGEARRPPPPGSSSSSPRPVQSTRAPAPRARPPPTLPCPVAATGPPRLRGVGGSRAPALGPRARDGRLLIPRSALGRRAAAGARELPRLSGQRVGSGSFLPGRRSPRGPPPRCLR